MSNSAAMTRYLQGGSRNTNARIAPMIVVKEFSQPSRGRGTNL
jgi:hypothetical protein